MRRTENPACLDKVFNVIVEHAVANKRCPENDTAGVTSDVVAALARAGRIRVEISGHNYRTIVILEGEHAGKTTAPDPTRRMPWKIIGKSTVVNVKPYVGRAANRRQPSAPRVLTREEIFGASK